VYELHQEALREMPPGDIRVEPRQFAESIEDFGVFVRELTTRSAAPSDDEMARSLEYLSLVLKQIPQTDEALVAERTEQMRQAAGRMRDAGPPGSPPVRDAFFVGFRAGIRTLLEAAHGPYGADPTVRARTIELEAVFDPSLEYEEPLPYDVAVIILRRAVFVLKAISQARTNTAELF
jgi:hypothetical protein